MSRIQTFPTKPTKTTTTITTLSNPPASLGACLSLPSLQWSRHCCGTTLLALDVLLMLAHGHLAFWDKVLNTGDNFNSMAGSRGYNGRVDSSMGTKGRKGGGWFPDKEYEGKHDKRIIVINVVNLVNTYN
mmetsp:Transcript_24316/g.51155  ORF Transcript_24316/g.51155 Transcript_24316/m.51155 type:complete len:130 (+) Transcript_24316:152-541(+)